MSTGFYAYWIYVTVKNIHFGSRKYDITRQRLPKKDQFIKTWNQGRKDKDGILFYKVESSLPFKKEEFIRCFAYYYMKNPQFHVSDILNDGFNLYRQNEIELDDILGTVKSDFLTAILRCEEKDIDRHHMFYGTNQILPIIFRLYDQGKISVNSLIAFNEVFPLAQKVSAERDTKTLNIVDLERCKKYAIIFDKYQQIVYNSYKDIDWKDILQSYHKQIMQRGPNAT